jgi:hypothetical protein
LNGKKTLWVKNDVVWTGLLGGSKMQPVASLQVHEDGWHVDVHWNRTWEPVSKLKGPNAEVLEDSDLEFKERDGVLCAFVPWHPEKNCVIHKVLKKYADLLTPDQVDLLSPATRKRKPDDDLYSTTIKRPRKGPHGKIFSDLEFSPTWAPWPQGFPRVPLKAPVLSVDHVNRAVEFQWGPMTNVDLAQFRADYPNLIDDNQYIKAVGEASSQAVGLARPAKTGYNGFSKNGSDKQLANATFAAGAVNCLAGLPPGIFCVTFLDAEGLCTTAAVTQALKNSPDALENKTVRVVPVNDSPTILQEAAHLPHAKQLTVEVRRMCEALELASHPIAAVFLDYCCTLNQSVLHDLTLLFSKRKLSDCAFLSLTVSRRKSAITTPELAFETVVEIARQFGCRPTLHSKQTYGLMMVLHMECRWVG